MTNQQDNREVVVVEGPGPHVAAVAGLIAAAFEGEAEARLVEALRADGAVVGELVALAQGKPVGHVMFSALVCAPPDRRLAALAPVAVLPERQRTGIGGMLIRAGLDLCRQRGIDAVTVLGDPAYYRRFGFAQETARNLESVYSGVAFMALELREKALKDGRWKLTYPRAFETV